MKKLIIALLFLLPTVADFNDSAWTSPTGDLFTAKIWREA
jgi:hypothetical protein